MAVFHKLISRVEGAAALDGLAKPVVDIVAKVVKPRPVRNALSGTYIGHPMHPMLTDLPIGAWGAATLLDLIGGESARPAADKLVAVGALAAVPTAAAGLNDWSDTYGPETRVGFVHAAAIHAALAAYVASLVARRRGRRGLGKALGLLGFGALTAGGYLGGYLSFVKGTNVNRAAWLEETADWTEVLDDADLPAGELRKVDAAGTPVMLYRWQDGHLDALSAVCTHMGGPLDEGAVADGCVTCPWHGSQFRLSDGSIVRGPACTAQPTFETRVHDGKIEVRSAR